MILETTELQPDDEKSAVVKRKKKFDNAGKVPSFR
jgi:hypothetical protein